MVTVACPRCQEPVLPGAHFCPSCGLDVSGPQGALTTAHVPPVGAALRKALAEQLEHLREATLGEYDIAGELGRGGMATVYLAHDIALDRKVAIKVMHPGVLLNEGMADRFKREARTAASLTHPHIIPVHLVRETPHILFFVMKYVEGRGLDSILVELGPLPIKMVQTILLQVGGALGYAHRRGVVHRDIKPANIMIDSEGWAVVTDFGIAKVAEGGSLTVSGATVGTPSYMSPEQCSARPVTGASDQYSLGIVGFEMLTGSPPFGGDSLMDIMRKHFFEPPPRIHDVRPDCPPALANVITRMVAKEPERRWSSLEEAVAAIGAPSLGHDDPVRTQMIELAKTGIKPVARLPAPTSPPPAGRPATVAARTAPHRSRRSKALVWGGVTVAALAAGVGVQQQLRWTAGARSPPPVGAPPDSVATVAISGAPDSLAVGRAARLTAIVRNAAGDAVPSATVRWSSRDSGVATVSREGLVTAVGAGSAVITAASGAERDRVGVVVHAAPVAARAPPAVPPPIVASITVSPPTVRLRVGDSVPLSAVARDASRRTLGGRAIGWRSSDAAVARVSPAGMVSGVSPGTAGITATADGVRSNRASVTVERVAPPAPATLRLLVTPWANVSIDGRNRGQRDRLETTEAAGVPHRIRLERDGFVTVDTTITLDPGEVRLLRVQLRRSP